MAASDPASSPQVGDMYRCEKCSLEIHVTQGCQCYAPCADFRCCGQPMAKVTEPEVQNP